MDSPCPTVPAAAQSPPAKPPALPTLWVEVVSGKVARVFCAGELAEEHALGAGHAAGRRLWQLVRRTSDDPPVAVLLWAASTFHLRDRDAWIGRDATTRSRRLDLIVTTRACIGLEPVAAGKPLLAEGKTARTETSQR